MRKSYIVLTCMALLISCQSRKITGKVQPIEVKVMRMSASVQDGEQRYAGTVEEANGTSLSYSVGGTVKQVLIDEGQRVSRGQLLAIMDDRTARNAYLAALSMRRQIEDAYKRKKQLHDNGSLPEIQWVDAISKLQQAVSSEQIAKKSLDDTKLYAPFSGVISKKNIDVGQNMMPSEFAFKLVNINQVKVNISIPEDEIAQFRIGQSAIIKVSALNGRMFDGRICEKGVSADVMSRSYDLKIIIDNKDGKLMPGMICEVSICKLESMTVLVLPASVIQLDDKNKQFVWINADGKAEKRMVTTSLQTNKGIIITDGLSEGDEVVVEGQQKVSEHVSLKIKR